MPLFEMTREDLVECKPVTFTHLEIKERAGLQPAPGSAATARAVLMAFKHALWTA